MNYRVFHTPSSCVHDWEFDFSGVWSTNQQGHGLNTKLSASSASVRHVVVHFHCMLTISLALNAMQCIMNLRHVTESQFERD